MTRPTLRDVAERAGVSVSTVSYVLNGSRSVALADATRERVGRAAAELGYVPNGLARSLRSQSSGTIGMILGKPLTSGRYAAIAEGAASALRAQGRHLALLGEGEASSAVRDVRAQRLDGLVFVGHDDRSVPPELAALVVEHDVPFVAIDCHPDAAPPYPAVDVDYALGVAQAYDDLAARGVREVLYLRPDIDSPAERVRMRAIEAQRERWPHVDTRALSSGMTAAGLAALETDPTGAPARTRDLADRVHAALAASAGPADRVALLCAWGVDAEAAYAAARRIHPGIRVTALAAGTLSTALWPGLAFSRLPLEQAGREAARLILGPRRAGEPERVLLAPELVTADPPPKELR